MTNSEQLARNAIAEFNQALDKADGAAMAALFGATGKLTVRGNALQGEEALKKFVERVSSSFPRAQHWEGNVLLGQQNNFFTNYSYWQCIYKGKIVSYGTHEDLISVKDNRATFVTRVVTHTYSDSSVAVKAPRKKKRRNAKRSAVPDLVADHTVYVGGLHKAKAATKATIEEALQKEFAKFGKIETLFVTERFAYVSYGTVVGADSALAAFANKQFDVEGVSCIVEKMKPKTAPESVDADAAAAAAPSSTTKQ